MSAETLRLAAALMRERAEAASHWEPAAWFAVQGAVYGGTAAPHQVITPVTTYANDAEHIASWHPVVALAIAGWLEAEAQAHIHLPGRDQTKSVYDMPGMESSPALAAARAYLGETA